MLRWHSPPAPSMSPGASLQQTFPYSSTPQNGHFVSSFHMSGIIPDIDFVQRQVHLMTQFSTLFCLYHPLSDDLFAF